MKWERNCRNCANLVIAPRGYRVCFELVKGQMVEVGRGEHCCEKWERTLKVVRAG